MDAYAYSAGNSAPSSSSSAQLPYHYQPVEGTAPPPPAYRSVRKIPPKKIIKKKPIAPIPPIPPKVYRVDAADFRDVVQRLTAAPEFKRRRLQELAPPPLSLSPPSPLGFSLSPSSLAWCSSILFSPRAHSPTVL